MTTHTVDEALERFALVKGSKGDGEKTACATSLLSWVAGEAWTDRLECAHPLLNTWAIQAHDAAGTTAEQQVEIVRAGETGILDTWWVPADVVLWAYAQAPRDASLVARAISTFRSVSVWKRAEPKARPYLGGANLRGAYLGDTDLGDANLRGANLRGANLRDADLGGANLRGANLRGANLRGANLGGANLGGANLRGAYLGDADLGGANLRGANLRDADLGGAYYTQLTIWPDGFDPKAAGAELL